MARRWTACGQVGRAVEYRTSGQQLSGWSACGVGRRKVGAAEPQFGGTPARALFNRGDGTEPTDSV